MEWQNISSCGYLPTRDAQFKLCCWQNCSSRLETRYWWVRI